MKKLVTLVITCSFALAAGAFAQQDDAQATPAKKKQQQREQQHEQRAQARENRQQARQPAAERAAARMHEGAKARAEHGQATPAGAEANTNANVRATEKMQARQQRRNQRNAAENANTANNANANNNSKKNNTSAPVAAKAQTNANTEATTTQNANVRNRNNKGKAQAQVNVQQIKQQHASFHAQPKPQQVPSVTFKQNYRISGSDQWQGERYAAFRSYRPERHDQGWYRSHYTRIELIGGGYYYFNNGYWYPAWGYAPTESYYAYNGPIYVGQQAEPPDRVIADVQAELQAMGYYKGEVDGLLGPLTRQALTGYQRDHGLYTTAAIDEPTLASLGLG